MKRWLIPVLLVCVAPLHAAAPDWATILTPAKIVLPVPQEEVVWRADLHTALTEAQLSNRPVFVTLRCLPCKQCSAFDKDVLEGGAALDPLLKQFITVRLTSAKEVDLRILPMATHQDTDLSWWGYFLSPQGQVYGVFGGRDEVSDETRISVAALANTLQRVLEHHYDTRRAGWHIDRSAPDLSKPLTTPVDLPGYKSWFAKSGPEVKVQTCIHCHQVGEILRQPAIDARTFSKQRDTQIWPLPENVGMRLDRDHGLRITSITPDSAAAVAGLKPGDILAAANDERLFGQADFRGVLHRLPTGDASVSLVYLRNNQVQSTKLSMHGDWKKTVLDWRTTISQGNFGAYPGFWPLAVSAAERKKLGLASDVMAVKPYVGNRPTIATKAGLKTSEVITAINGESPNLNGRGLLVWLNMRHEPGDTITLTVASSPTQKRQISYRLVPRGQEN